MLLLSMVHAQGGAGSGTSSSPAAGGSSGSGGYTSTSQPVVIDQPSEEFLDSADHAESGTTTYDGTSHYSLHQGSRRDDKLAWANTDYIRWEAQAATLRASGRCHDGDPKDATRVSSKAWGAQIVETKIKAEDGDRGTILAENRMGFSYAYNISGARVLEATVQLTGEVVDIKGNHHRFNVSDTRAESITEQFFHSEVRQQELSGGGAVTVGVSRRGPTAAPSADLNFTTSETSLLDITIVRRLAEAGSEAGGATGPLVTDEVSGDTPLETEHQVFSAAGVVLSARGDSSSGGGSTVVVLDHFLVQNTIRVFVTVESAYDDPGPPSPTGPTTPSDGSGPGSPGADPGSGGPSSGPGSGQDPDDDGSTIEGAPEGADEPLPDPDPEPDSESETQSGEWDSMSLTDLPGLEGRTVTARVRSPFGHQGEPGGSDGQLNLVLSEPAPRDLVFAVSIEPEGAVAFPRGATLTILQGELSAGGPVGNAVGDRAFFSLHLLSSSGERSGYELVVQTDLVSTSSRLEPTLYACAETEAALPGATTLLSGIRGGRTPDLLIGRSGFDGFEETATTLELELDDPSGVLPPLPATVSIGPGEREVCLPIQLQSVEGEATIRVRHGETTLEILVCSHKQRWAAPPTIRIPLGAIAPVPYRLLHSEIDSRQVVAVIESTGTATAVVEAGAESDFVPAGALLWAVPVRGTAIGTSSVRVDSEGMDPLFVPIEIVPARVEIIESKLRLSNLPVGTSGTIAIRSASGQVFARLEVPPELQDHITITGLGTDQIVVSLSATPDLPAVLDLALEFAAPAEAEAGGTPIGPGARFDVEEILIEDALPSSRNNYQIEWR
jgi:hypothetical protein